MVLIGLMGSGKSTIGHRLAQSLDWAFCDTDKEIERSTGADIPWIFEKEGEAGFRKREHQALAEALERPDQILSTGGGVVELSENRDLLRKASVQVVYLYAPPGALYRRVGNDPNRPLLAQGNARDTLQRLFDRRDPWYREVADLVVPTHRSNLREVVEHIYSKLRS